MCGCDALHKHNAFNFERTHKHISTQRTREEKKQKEHTPHYAVFIYKLCWKFMPSWMPKDTKNTIQLREYLHGNSINQVIYVLQFVLLLLLQLRKKKYETNNMKFIVAVIRHWVTVRAPDLSPTCLREQKMVLCTKHTQTDATIFLKCSHATLFN